MLKYLFIFIYFTVNVFSKTIKININLAKNFAVECEMGDITPYIGDRNFNVFGYINNVIKPIEKSINFDGLYYFYVQVDLGADRKKVTFNNINADGMITFNNDVNFDTISIYALTSNAIDKLRSTVIEKFKFYYTSSDNESDWMKYDIKPFEDIGEFKRLLLGKTSDFIAEYAKDKVLKYCYDNKLIDNDYEFNKDNYGTLHLAFYGKGASDDDIWKAVDNVFLRDFFTNKNLTKVAIYIPIAFPVKLKFEYNCLNGTELRKEKLNYWGKTYPSAYGDEVFLASEKTLYFGDKREITIVNIRKEVSKIMSNEEDYSPGRGYYEQGDSINYDGDVNVKYSKGAIYKFIINIPEWSERLKSIFIDVDPSKVPQLKGLEKLKGLYIIHGPKFGDDEGKTEFIRQLKVKRGGDTSGPLSDDCINELANGFYVNDFNKNVDFCCYDSRGFGNDAVVNYIKKSKYFKPYLGENIDTVDGDTKNKRGNRSSKIGLPNNSCCSSCCKCCGNCCKGCKGGKCSGG